LNPAVAWAQRHRILAAPDAVVVDVPWNRRGQRAAAAALRVLPPGRGVILRGSSSSVNAVARAAHVRVARELIALPSASAPAYLVEDDAAPLAQMLTEFLSVPPGLVWLAAPAGGLLRAGGLAAQFKLCRRLLRSRIAVGWRV
jgi:hypothetical protein